MVYDASPLVPRAVLFGHPDRRDPQISPDGRWLAYLAPDEGVLNLWVGGLDGAPGPRPVTHDRGRGVAAYGFCHDDRTVVYVQDVDGDENWRVYLLDLDTGASRCVTPHARVQAQILRHNRWHPTTMLLGLNADRPQLHDVYRLDVRTGAVELVERNPGFASWIFDSDLRVRGGVSVTEDGGVTIRLREPGSDEFVPWRTIPPGDVPGTDVLGFTRDGKTLLLLSSVGANTARLVAVDLASGSERVIAEDPRFDVGGVTLDPETLEPQAVTFAKDRNEWVWLDPEFGAVVDRLRASLDVDGEIAIDRTERTDRTWLVPVMPSDGPLRYYAHNRDTGELQCLFTHKPELARYRLATMQPFHFAARDGLDVHGYLSFPPEVDDRDLPAVVNVHGGPWARDTWGYHPEAQWLANRGYVCIQVNYRGSTGYGKAFCGEGDKEWGRRMQDDLVDAVSFCVARGWVDPGRVAIMGTSYGGYAALAAAAFTNGVFRCAVDLCGPSNLLTLLEAIPPYWKPMIAFMHARVGDPRTERDMLWARSPLSQVDAVDIPLLIGHGRNDPRVRQDEAEQIVAALRAKGLPHEYLVFDDEGHGLVRPENRERFYAAAERFLAAHLGGRFEGTEG